MLLIIVVCLLKSMCIPSFVLIVSCVSELRGHLSSYHYYGLRLFIVVLTILLIIAVCLLKSMCIPSFVLIVCCVNELLGHLVMYGLRLFIVALQEQHCLPNCLHI